MTEIGQTTVLRDSRLVSIYGREILLKVILITTNLYKEFAA